MGWKGSWVQTLWAGLILAGCAAPVSDVEEDSQPDHGDFIMEWGDDEGYEDLAQWMRDPMEWEADFLNDALKLPYDLVITHQTCGMENAWWDGVSITMCYEMLDHIDWLFWDAGLRGEDLDLAVLDTWVFILYHELGHALIDIYDLPVPGREEDAVDAFSAVVLIDGGVPDAVVNAAFFWLLEEEGYGGGSLAFADEHSLNMQRFYNLLCWVYGSDPDGQDWLLDAFPELADRAGGGRCEMEYQDQLEAWDELLSPWYQ